MQTEAMRSLRGTKRTCRTCEVRFYDLGRDPTICPSCGASLPPSDFETARQQTIGYQPSSFRSPKPKLAVVQDDHGTTPAIEGDTDEAGEDESSTSDTDGDVLLEEESDDDVANLPTRDESDTDSE
jgi:uncharacterized protein (TIGR02300 family)